jgi:acid phosphatase type 7
MHKLFLILFTALFITSGCQKLNLSLDKSALSTPFEPSQVVLTWQQDPATTMTITWRTDSKLDTHVLRYALSPQAPASAWRKMEATSFTFAETKAWLHTAELTGLTPDTDYYVVIEHDSAPDIFSFRTMPSRPGDKQLVILAGGDSRSRRDIRREMNQLAIDQDPDFIIFDGDFINIALSEEEWDEWFDDWHELMITPQGRRIPIITGVGNHEVQGGFNQTRDQAPFFLNRFITPQPRNYYALEFGNELVIITLDSEHLTPVTQQTHWLDSTLTAHQDKSWKIVQYHVAAWPSVRAFDNVVPILIREHWIPILEKHNVNIVVEAHDHAFKKTAPIRNNQRDDENGIVYIGDGGWGAPVRQTKNPADHWWLDEAFEADHFWKLTLSDRWTTFTVEPIFRPIAKEASSRPLIYKQRQPATAP